MQLYDAQGRPKRYQTNLPLADGQLPDAQGAIYTSAAGTKSLVRKFTLANTNAATQTIDLYLNVSGTPRLMRRIELLQFESADVLSDGEEIVLDGGDSIEAVTTTTAAVDFYIGGATEK